MSKRVILIHGVLSNGSLDVNRLAPFWEEFDYEVIRFSYGVHLAVAIWNQEWAVELSEIIQDGDVLCCHSNANVLALKAALLGAPISQIVMVAPALPSNFIVAPQVKHVHVWYSPYDEATAISGLVYKEWGLLGNIGYTGDDPRVTTYDRSTYRVPSRFHLDMFTEPRLSYFGKLYVGHVEEKAAELAKL